MLSEDCLTYDHPSLAISAADHPGRDGTKAGFTRWQSVHIRKIRKISYRLAISRTPLFSSAATLYRNFRTRWLGVQQSLHVQQLDMPLSLSIAAMFMLPSGMNRTRTQLPLTSPEFEDLVASPYLLPHNIGINGSLKA